MPHVLTCMFEFAYFKCHNSDFKCQVPACIFKFAIYVLFTCQVACHQHGHVEHSWHVNLGVYACSVQACGMFGMSVHARSSVGCCLHAVWGVGPAWGCFVVSMLLVQESLPAEHVCPAVPLLDWCWPWAVAPMGCQAVVVHLRFSKLKGRSAEATHHLH